MTRLLLDTHTVLWALGSPEVLREDARRAIVDVDNDVFLSAASAWEMGVKVALGKLRIPDDLALQARASGFTELSVDISDGLAVQHLPPHHRDPFDRLLVVQAQRYRSTIVTRDQVIPRYDIPVLEA